MFPYSPGLVGKVLIVHPPVDVTPLAESKGPSSEYPLMPMGLFTMADYLERNGVEADLVNLALERMLNPSSTLERIIKGLEADIIAISLHWFVHSYGAIEAARAFKKLFPNSKVVFGGFTSSFFAKEIVETYPFVDAVIVGEGEETILELAKSREWGKINGLVYRQGRKAVWNGWRKPVPNLESYTFTNIKVYDRWQLYLKCSPSGYLPTRRPSFWLSVARSCLMNCAYCGGGYEGYKAAMGREEAVVRNPSRLAEDCAILVDEYGVEIVKLSHDPLIWGERYYSELMEEISKRGIDAKAYWDLTYLPREEQVKKALKAFEGGICWGLSLETTSDRARMGVGRPYSLADIEGFLTVVQKHEVILDGYFLVGLPWCTREDVERDMDYAIDLMKRYRNVYMVPPFPYTMDPHAPMALRPKDYGVRKLCSSFECYRRLVKGEKWENWVVHETDHLSKSDIVSLTKKFFKRLEEAYSSGDYGENVAGRYSFEHKGTLLALAPR